jgi:hypothetical protein
MSQVLGTFGLVESKGICILAWVQGKRKMSQVLGTFGLLDFIHHVMARSRLAGVNLRTVHCFNFPKILGHSKPRILNQRIRGHDCMWFHKANPWTAYLTAWNYHRTPHRHVEPEIVDWLFYCCYNLSLQVTSTKVSTVLITPDLMHCIAITPVCNLTWNVQVQNRINNSNHLSHNHTPTSQI